MKTILIIGASRGIGHELARQYLAEGARVLATHRRAEDATALRALGAEPLPLDLLDAGSLAAFAGELAHALHRGSLDVAILNAGVYGTRTSGLEAPPADEFDLVMRTNVWAPMQLIPELVPRLAAGARLAVLSSVMGSTGAMAGTAGWLYRASKAALNNVLRAASLDLGAQGVICLALHPGWVRTDMGGAGADLDVATSASGLLQVIAAADATQNGSYLDYRGESIPW